jgi:nitroreductase
LNVTHNETEFTPLIFERLAPEEQLDQSRRFMERMRERRTVRQFSSEPVPYELIANAIATAGSAPSGANQQPWTFVVVSSSEVKRQIRQAAEEQERLTYEQRMSEEWRSALRPLGTDWQKPHLEDAPYLIVVFVQTYGVRENELGEIEKVKHYYAIESVGIAVGMLLCSLHLSGLVTLTHTPNPMGFLNEILERPPNERGYMVIPVGYPAPNAQVPAINRKPLHQILLHVK